MTLVATYIRVQHPTMGPELEIPFLGALASSTRFLSKPNMILKNPAFRMATDTLHLSTQDQNTVRVYTQTLTIFPFRKWSLADTAIKALNEGLRAALVKFPFLAGTLSLSASGSGKLTLTYPTEIRDTHMNDYFAWKTISDFPYTYDQLKRDGMPPSAFKAETFRPDALLKYPGVQADGEGIVDFQTSDAPVMRVQANFIPGGLVLSIYAHHSVMDCAGVANFFQEFGKHVSAAHTPSKAYKVDIPGKAAAFSLT